MSGYFSKNVRKLDSQLFACLVEESDSTVGSYKRTEPNWNKTKWTPLPATDILEEKELKQNDEASDKKKTKRENEKSKKKRKKSAKLTETNNKTK